MKEKGNTIEEQGLRRQKITIGLAFKFRKIAVGRNTGSRKGFLQARSGRKYTRRIEHTASHKMSSMKLWDHAANLRCS